MRPGRKPGPSVLNDWEVAEVLHEARYEPYHVVARRHGISEKTVMRWMRFAGLRKGKKVPIQDVEYALLLKMWNDGKSGGEIAQATGLTKGCVYSRVRRMRMRGMPVSSHLASHRDRQGE